MVIFGIGKRLKELERIVRVQQETINCLVTNQVKLSKIVSRLVDKAETELVEETRKRLMKGVAYSEKESPIIVRDPLTKKKEEN